MNKNKILKVCLIILAIFCIAAIVEISLRAITKSIADISQKVEEKKHEEIIYNSEEKQIEREIQTFIQNIINAIQDNDYDYIYSLLDSNYNKYKFNNEIEKMKKYIDENFPREANYVLTDINQYSGTYHIIISKEIDEVYTTQYLTAIRNGQNNYNLILENYEYIAKKDLKYVKDDIEYTISYEYRTSDITNYVIDITNKTNKVIDVKFDIVTAASSNGKKFQSTLPENEIIGAYDTKRVEVAVLNKNILISSLQLETIQNSNKEIISFVFENGM